MPTLTVLYVVRNEEGWIDKSIESIQGIADEILVVDTGSRDRTLQHCRKFRRTKIVSHAWLHDFSRTKNYGITQCSSDWILCLDADEMLDKRGCSEIKKRISEAQNNVVAMSVKIVDHPGEWSVASPANKDSFFQERQVRLFRRVPGLTFIGRVGESIEESAKNIGGIDTIDVNVHHNLWHGKGSEYSALKISYYNKLGANMKTDEVSDIKEDPKTFVHGVTPIAIVIPAMNALTITKECLSSVCKNTSMPYSLVLIDNGSTDDTDQYFTSLLGNAPIRFQKNMGVPKAKNAGISAVLRNPSIKYICFLDNDTKVEPGWIEAMTKIMDENENVGMVGPLSSSASGPQNIFGDSGKIDYASIHFNLGKRNPEYFTVNSIGGFCMVVRVEMVKKLGMFEESFGTYGCEDIDYCMRARRAGYDIAVANRVFVEHRGRATLLANRLDIHHSNIVSANRFTQKWKMLPTAAEISMATSPLKHRSVNETISVVILTCNRLDMTSQCLNALVDNTKNFELIVVDNGSTDGTKEWIKTRIPRAILIENEKNMGVPIARNQGIMRTTTDYVVLMDNDVLVKAGWSEDFLDRIKSGYDGVGIEAWQINSDFAACHKCQSPNERFDYLGGACTMFKRSVYEKIGLLDEGFSPAYYEDVEFCIRALKAGFKLAWLPSTRMIHKEHSTLLHGQKDFLYSDALTKSHKRFASKMKGEITMTELQLPTLLKRLKILYLGMQYDYGIKDRGLSFEHNNFFPALRDWDRTKEMMHFDFVEIGQNIGIDAMSNKLLEAVNSFAPDAIFAVWFDENHDPRRETLKRISDTTSTKVVSWFCDSHFRYENFDKHWAPFSDYCVTTSASGYQKYVQDGFALKVIKSQWGTAPIYRKLPTPLDMNVTFVGQPHGDRRQIIDQIRSSGVDIQTFGTGWDKRLSFDEMIEMFNRSRININLNNACDVRFKQIKGRNFEVPGCGGFLLTEAAENLGEYYEFSKEIVVYQGIPDMIEKAKYYLAHEDERATIALAGYQRTMKDHTYATRFEHIFKKAGLI